MNKHSLPSLFAICLVVSACSDDDGGSLDVDVESPSSFCRAAAATACSTMYACLTEAELRDKELPATVAECERQFESSCESSVDRCEDGAHEYASNKAGACLDQMEVAQCNDAAEPYLDAPACREVCRRTAGAFQVRWEFSPTYYSCSQLELAQASVVATAADGTVFEDRYYCDDHGGITANLPLGTYSVRLELYAIGGNRVWTSAAVSATLDDAIVDLGTVVVPVAQ